MPRRRLACFLTVIALTTLAAAALAEPELQTLGTLETPIPRDWEPWGSDILVATDLDVRLVQWGAPAGERDDIFFTLPAPPTLMESWGDSVLVQVPGEGGRLVDRQAFDPTTWVGKPANWRLPNVAIGGETYRIFVDPQFYLIVYTAPGPGVILSLLDFEETIVEATHWAWDGARAVLGNDDGLHIVDLSNPLAPLFVGFAAPPVPGWTVDDLAMRGDVAFVKWGDRLATFDISGSGTPPLLDEVVISDTSLALGPRWLASWNGDDPTRVNVIDAGDPAALVLRGSAEVPIALDDALVQVGSDRVEISHELGIEAHLVPFDGGPITALGYAWPVMEGWPLAVAGNTAWLQGLGSRFVLDLAGPTIPLVQIRETPTTTASLHPAGDVLYYNPGGERGVVIEDLADPAAPAIVTILDPEPGIEGIDVAGDLLAGAGAGGLVLYDVSDPAAPARRGDLALIGAPERVVLVDETAVVTAVRDGEPDLVHVVDIADRDQPVLVASFELDPDPDASGPVRVAQAVRRGDRVHVLVTVGDGTGSLAAHTATVDLADPASPQLVAAMVDSPFWCYEPDESSGALRPTLDLPATIGGFHVSFRADTVIVHDGDGSPDGLIPLTTWMAPGPVATLATVGTRLLVLTERRLDLLTLSDPDPVDAPDLVPPSLVRAVPNPFNPRTRIGFAMPGPGTARVEIYNLQGRRVRALTADLPAGPAQLAWSGDDDRGRAVPSGTYLLRVHAPGTVMSGRCQLVR